MAFYQAFCFGVLLWHAALVSARSPPHGGGKSVTARNTPYVGSACLQNNSLLIGGPKFRPVAKDFLVSGNGMSATLRRLFNQYRFAHCTFFQAQETWTVLEYAARLLHVTSLNATRHQEVAALDAEVVRH